MVDLNYINDRFSSFLHRLPMNNSPQQLSQYHLSSCSNSSNDPSNQSIDPNEEMLQMASTSRPLQHYHFSGGGGGGGGFYDSSFPISLDSPLPLPPRPPRTGHSTLLDPNESINLSSYFDRLSGVTDAGAIFDAKLACNFNFNWPDDFAAPNFPDYNMPVSQNSYLESSLMNGNHVMDNTGAMEADRAINSNNGLESDLGGSNSTASSATPQSITINPFDSHGLVSHSERTAGEPNMNEMLLSGLHWGSDPHFASSGYRPPLPPITTNDDVRDKVFSMIQKAESADSTAVNSPVDIKYETIGTEMADGTSRGIVPRTQTPSPSPSITTSQGTGTKRRASGATGDLTTRKAMKKGDSESDNSTPKKRKKSVSGKREHLTEEEKRANHIQSEQKRRNIIRQGFEDLCSLVPDLRSGGFSKSAVLTHAANYLIETKKGNERLKAIIRQLEAGQRI